ncbi:MAG: hypothetical protein AB1468_04270 [Candidatus Micrarchaeota archaeon]
MELEGELRRNIRSFFNSARIVYETGDFTSAFILYFKTLVAISDYVLLVKGLGVPKDHNERFRMLEQNIPELYRIVDRYFTFYRSSYSTSVSKKICDEVVSYVKLFAKKYKIPEIGQ